MNFDSREDREKFIVATLITHDSDEEQINRSLDELVSLIDTAGGEVVEKVIQKREKPDPGTFIGRGKAEEIKMIAKMLGVSALAVDARISPSQQRNLEEITGLKILDRTAVILDIFATHAKTLEGKLQVELAQLSYLQTRLIGLGTQLSRLGGGIGTRGPGETKLEVDRRRIKKRIQILRKKLEKIEKHRERIRSKRREHAFLITLAGYTNAGKSTLLNALTEAGVYADNKLFATLDSTARKLNIMKEIHRGEISADPEVLSFAASKEFVITDTVGFIDNLPAELINAFHSTLEDVSHADLIIHVVDISNEDFRRQMRVVEETLERVGAAEVPRLTVLNKTDLCDETRLKRLKEEFSDACFVSAAEKTGLKELKQRILQIAMNNAKLSRT